MIARVERIDSKRRALLERVAGMEPDRITRRPAPDRWSIREIVEHLVLAERDIANDFRDLETFAAARPSLKDRILYRAVLFVLRFRIRVKVPAPTLEPTGDRDLDELRATWDDNHARLHDVVTKLDRSASRRAIFLHPVAGPIDVPQMLRILELHLDGHTKQIEQVHRELGG